MKVALDFECRMKGNRPVEILGFALAWFSHGVVKSKAYKWGTDAYNTLMEVIDVAISGEPYNNGEPVELVFHVSKFELAVIKHLMGRQLPATTDWYEDTFLLAYELDSGSLGNLGLDALAKEYLGVGKIEDKGTTDWHTAVWSDQMAKYCARDAELTVKLWHAMVDKVDSTPLASIYELSKSWTQPIIEMEHNGLHVNQELHRNIINELEQIVDHTLGELRSILPLAPSKARNYYEPKDDDDLVFVCKREVKDTRKSTNTPTRTQWCYKQMAEYNPNSSLQTIWGLQHLYGWKPPAPKRGKTQPSMDAAAINNLLDEHPDWRLLEVLSEYNQANKLLTSFGESLAERVDEDSRLRGEFRRGTITHRLSSANPNLQQIPKRSSLGKLFRGMFTAPAGTNMLVADKSQFQLKIIASLSYLLGNRKYLDLLLSGLDAHTATQTLMKLEDRTTAKNLNFGTAFGAMAPTLQRTMSKGGTVVSLGEAEALLEKLDSELSLSTVKQSVWRAAKKQGGYYITPHGHLLFYPDICKDPKRYKYDVLRAERQLFNAVIQSWESYVMCSLARICQYGFAKLGLDARLCAIVHDELVVEVSEADTDKAQQFMTEAFSYPYWLPGFDKVTHPEAAEKGNSWGSCH